MIYCKKLNEVKKMWTNKANDALCHSRNRFFKWYNCPIPGIQTTCTCGEKFNVQHALSCKTLGFITIRRNEVGDITATEVCKNVKVKLSLIKL